MELALVYGCIDSLGKGDLVEYIHENRRSSAIRMDILGELNIFITDSFRCNAPLCSSSQDILNSFFKYIFHRKKERKGAGQNGGPTDRTHGHCWKVLGWFSHCKHFSALNRGFLQMREVLWNSKENSSNRMPGETEFFLPSQYHLTYQNLYQMKFQF